MALALVHSFLAFSSILAGDWPQFLGPNRDGQAPGETIRSELSPANATVLWKSPAGPGFSGPVRVGSRVVLFHSEENAELLECFDASTGKSLWKLSYPCDYAGGFGTGPGPRATPAIAEGVIYTFGATAVAQAVVLETGKRVWMRDLGAELRVPEGFFGVGPSPLIEGDKLLLTVGGKKGSLLALDLKTGATRWSAAEDEASYASPILATLGDDRIALFFARTGLHVVDPSTGMVRDFFRFRARIDASVNAATPILVKDRIFLSSQYGVGSTLLEWSGGRLKPVWKIDEGLVCHYDTPVFHEGCLYGIDGRAEAGGKLVCMRVEDAKVLWESPPMGCASIVRAGDRLLLWTDAGELRLVDATPADYRPRGLVKLASGETRSPLALADGVAYVRSADTLFAVDVRP